MPRSHGGDSQEGAAALVAIDASPKVRKKRAEVLRHVAPPHDLDGLRLAFQDGRSLGPSRGRAHHRLRPRRRRPLHRAGLGQLRRGLGHARGRAGAGRDSHKVARLAMHLLREREQQARSEAAPQVASASGVSASGVSAAATSVAGAP